MALVPLSLSPLAQINDLGLHVQDGCALGIADDGVFGSHRLGKRPSGVGRKDKRADGRSRHADDWPMPHQVNAVARNPVFNYNPDLFWDGDPSHAKAKIPAGPNNPVGTVWIDLSKEHYGIHGTPEPHTIGRSQSHGCVRLTNWDAARLAEMVSGSTRVLFEA